MRELERARTAGIGWQRVRDLVAINLVPVVRCRRAARCISVDLEQPAEPQQGAFLKAVHQEPPPVRPGTPRPTSQPGLETMSTLIGGRTAFPGRRCRGKALQ